MRNPILVAALVALFATSCGNDDRPMTRAEFCQHYSERECSNVASACLVVETDCQEVRKAGCMAWGQGEEDALRPRPFDPQNADACLAKVSAVFDVLNHGMAIEAKAYRSIGDACARVFHGNAAANDVCDIAADCSGTLICNKDHCGTLRQVEPNAGCANIGEDCTQGYYCGLVSDVLTCTARPGLGEACAPKIDCREDLRCNNGICIERLAIGFACQLDGDCVSGFCEPFALQCGTDVRFAKNSPACQAFQPTSAVPSGV